MKNKRSKTGLRVFVCTLLASLSMSTVLVYGAATTDDPIISLSYLDNIFLPKIISYIDQRFSSFTPNNNTSQTAESYEVVSLSAGKSLICDKGVELILRSGSASVIATIKGGLADVTIGMDLKDGANMPSNHHLIVPVDDGRGVKAASDCLLMVKGRYSIQ